MRMWIACLVVFLSLGISGTVCVGQGDIDDSIRKVDKLDLVKVEKDLKVVNDGMSKVTEQINKQFNEMMADVLSGTYSKNGYLQQLENYI